jgi:hypothetical protein
LAILKSSYKLRVRHADTVGAGRAKIGARIDNSLALPSLDHAPGSCA